MDKKDEAMEKTSKFNKFMESLSFMISFLWDHNILLLCFSMYLV